MDERTRTILDRDTLMPVSFAISLIIGTFWLSSKLTDIEVKVDKVESKLEDQWSSTEMENWSLKLKMANPEIEIPTVR
jgi:hypothetical protein